MAVTEFLFKGILPLLYYSNDRFFLSQFSLLADLFLYYFCIVFSIVSAISWL
uniref:Uncharacterized protein n=1 Tax=Anguilla anguilla TaxID=7936 RepID=A0A0E9W129_ANGAN